MPRSMARSRKKSAPPATVSRPALLVGGSDAEFRDLIHDLIAYGHRLDACRDAFADIAGISPDVMLVGKRASANTSAVTLRTSLTARNSSVSSETNPDTNSDGSSENCPSRHVPDARSTTSIREASRRSAGCCAISSSGSS